MRKQTQIIQILVLLVVLLVPMLLMAQDLQVDNQHTSSDAPYSDTALIYAGICLLLALGVGYGTNFLKKLKNKKNSDKQLYIIFQNKSS